MRTARGAAAEAGHTPARGRYEPVPLAAISVDLQAAVLAAEDIGFFGHGVVDTDEMTTAVKDWLSGRRLRGASTISQQLAKNLFLSEARTPWRKLDELRLAWWLERKLKKRRVFELYLNVIELGEGIYGVEAAARAYFGASAVGVTPAQALDLAASIPSPRHDNPATRSEAFAMRRDAVASRMAGAESLRARLAMARGASGPGETATSEDSAPRQASAPDDEPSEEIDEAAPDATAETAAPEPEGGTQPDDPDTSEPGTSESDGP